MPRIPLGRALSLIVALVAVVALAACTSARPRPPPRAPLRAALLAPPAPAAPPAAPGWARWPGTTARSAGSWGPASSAPACRSRSTTATRAGARSRWPCRRPRPPPRPASSWVTCWSTRAGREPAAGRWPPRSQTGLSSQRGQPVQHHRLRPARGRRVGARAELRPDFFSGVRANYVPASAAAEQTLENRAKTLRRRLRAALRLAAALHDHQGRGPGHGLDPVRAAASPRSATTPSPTAPTSARSTPRCSPAGSSAWCWTAPSTRAASGTPTTSTRTTPSRAGSRPSSPGWPSTTATISLGGTAAAGPAGLLHRPQQAAGPADRRVQRPLIGAGRAGRHVPARRLRRLAVAGPGPGPVQLPAAGLDQRAGRPVPGERRPERERVRRLQRGAVRGRQLAAQLGQVGQRHPQGLRHGAPSRPGTTPGTTRPARSGR